MNDHCRGLAFDILADGAAHPTRRATRPVTFPSNLAILKSAVCH